MKTVDFRLVAVVASATVAVGRDSIWTLCSVDWLAVATFVVAELVDVAVPIALSVDSECVPWSVDYFVVYDPVT